MKKINIGLVLRIYEEGREVYETRKDHISSECMPEDIMKDLIAGEVICVQVTPNSEALYFKVPDDWPADWTTH